MITPENTHTGLSDAEVLERRASGGSNALALAERKIWRDVLRDVVTEPMFILLIMASLIYFIVGESVEGTIMVISLFLVAGISLFQEWRSRNAIAALQKLSAAKARVRRNGTTLDIPADDIVRDDIVLVEEGEIIPADGLILESRDFSVNESLLTGESFSVYKNAAQKDMVYRGTLVTSGTAVFTVQAVGLATMYGKIGVSMQETATVRTPLQKQIRSFVRNMVWIGATAFVVVVGLQYYQSRDWLAAILQGLTLAMSVLPEEIPVAFSTFQALGAFRLLREKIIVKRIQQVETLGAATVICADKTGTLTQNRMVLSAYYDLETGKSSLVDPDHPLPRKLLSYAMWASEIAPFDPMEQEIHRHYEQSAGIDERKLFSQVHEYPIGGTPPMMTHIFRHTDGHTLIAAKGAPERLLRQSTLSASAIEAIEKESLALASQGLRVLGVGEGIWEGNAWPASQDDYRFQFLGLIAFQDPPKANIRETINGFEDAGIHVKMITGDYPETALAIARQAGLNHEHARVLTGKEILQLAPADLQQSVRETSIFARMFPEAKLRVINALQDNGEVVAMTGDGVNDGPALKAADIGIAMGQRGSEVARNAASLILMDDDLSHMLDAIALGRKIYDNLKKAIQYIISIHIPIILIVLLPLVLGWTFHDIFTPVHVIFLELLMGPTCSIIYENEPMEMGTMQRPPRKMGSTFLSFRQLLVSIIQGLVITAACLGLGYMAMQKGSDDAHTRSMIFFTLLFCNILLTLVNRSFRFTLIRTIRYKNRLVPLIIGISLMLVLVLLRVPPVRELFNLVPLGWSDLGLCLLAAAAGTLWIEPVKSLRRF